MTEPALIQPSLARDPSLVALARLPERITGLDVMPVVTLDIARVPAAALEHLADQFHMRHTVAWRRATLDAERRGLIKAAVWRHRIKGSLAAFELAARDAGGELLRAIVPPAKTFAGEAMTAAQRDAFLQRYPQLRVYPRRLAGLRVGAMLHRLYPGSGLFPVQTDAALRLAPQAFVYQAGRETPLQAMEREQQQAGAVAEQFLEVRAPGLSGLGAFCGRPMRWLTTTDAARRMYRLQLTVPYIDSREVLHRTAVSPGLEPISPHYDWVMGSGTEQGWFAGRYACGYLMRSTAADRIYKRIWLFDPDVSVARRGAMSFCGTSRLSMPAHHAELAVQLRGRIHARQFGRFLQGFIVAGTHADYHDAMEAMRDVARASDRISIDTAVAQPLTAGEACRAGMTHAGEWRNAIA